MKLRKDKWLNAILNDVSDVRDGTHDSPKYVSTNGIPLITQKNIREGGLSFDVFNLISIEDHIKISARSKVGYGDIILSMIGENRGMSCIINDKREFSIKNVGLIKTSNQDKLINQFLINVLQSQIYRKKLESKSSGTAQKFIPLNAIRSLEIPLPPLAEQQQIAALFQSLERAIAGVEEQAGRLKKLWKRLIDDFVSEQPTFGTLLQQKKLKTVRFCEVAEKLMRRIDPITYGVQRIVGGENLEAEDFKIRSWSIVGKDYLGPAFHVLFQSGDILYGSRRTYLRKVALADFEGVCANTTYVIRAKESVLLQGLLKYIMLSERFTQYSIGVSKGSTNPYINWKDLDGFVFQVPDISTQQRMIDVLGNIMNIIEQLKQQSKTLKQLKQQLLEEILG